MGTVYRVYYWFNGAPEDRPGGPWWWRDFPMRAGHTDFHEFMRDLKPFCHAMAYVTHSDFGDLAEMDNPTDMRATYEVEWVVKP